MKLITITDDFPPGFYEALGRLAVAFGRVEYEIKLAVKSLSGKGFTAGMAEAESSGQFARLCKKAKSLAAARRLPQPHLSTFARLLDDAMHFAPERNDTLHAVWTAHGNGSPRRFRPFWNWDTKQLTWRSRAVPVEELNGHAETLRA